MRWSPCSWTTPRRAAWWCSGAAARPSSWRKIQPPGLRIQAEDLRVDWNPIFARVAGRTPDDLDPAPDGLDLAGAFVYLCGRDASLHSRASAVAAPRRARRWVRAAPRAHRHDAARAW